MQAFPRLTYILTFLAFSAFAASAAASVPSVAITASSSSISAGQSDTLTVTATKAGSVHVTGSNGTSYDLPYSGGTISVAPSATTTYTATATNASGTTSAQTSVTVGSGSGGGTGPAVVRAPVPAGLPTSPSRRVRARSPRDNPTHLL